MAPQPAEAGRVALDASTRSSHRDAGKALRFRTASPFFARPLQTWPLRNAGRSTRDGYRWWIAQERKAARPKKKRCDPVMGDIGGDIGGGSGSGTGTGGSGGGAGNPGAGGAGGGGAVAVPTPSAAFAGVLGLGALAARRRTRA
ncbi:hypothetical protein PSMK_03470 [Phycisphaera mikurensis NBRC 102666]|uniref:Uncharacterized protein n=1 Tax=Phycisphaera mikurensis (strain NBRC 102666 / KCTC 22515 / FYK2301M01) TaxID=1142394 RepID=I0IB68_PHYMF|nr:hypothetical protein PSMK_03470 [Phycisphaera mikurensis NBRC 102666]